ncbi:hypothetical protein BDV95DRAFT_588845 [Massariosphaeria phaeospora]|uniref:DUF7703 domain-containing protein n=1 Tax=Massariosphaeria phaeospora TaxID=100035 RepID=A0A7C8MDJ3_9PLEO|nr:hypothetical protein BDV95DRAFT_588845 [Massariosphaeria phaeospora]
MARDNGIGTDYQISYPIALTIMAFLSIAMYNVVELTLVIFTTFKKRHGLYFYSLLVATWGIIPYGMGFFIKFYNLSSSTAVYITLIAIGWPCMITGQSLVLYSRLHLITRSTVQGGRWVLLMIIFDAAICHVPIIVLLYGANSPHPARFLTPYSIYEKVQITVFFLQEVAISGIYVWKTMQLLRPEGNVRGRNSRAVMTHLVWVNLMIIVLDITLLAIEYAGYYDIQTTYKAAVYSVKIKMEFSILNRLLDLFQGRIQDSSDSPHSRNQTAGFKKAAGKSNPTANGTANTGYAPALGNSAYARMDENASPTSGISLKDMEVVKTTEITVERSDAVPERGLNELDVESVGGNGAKATRVGRSLSASSSEIQIRAYMCQSAILGAIPLVAIYNSLHPSMKGYSRGFISNKWRGI